MPKRNHACDRYIGRRLANGAIAPFISVAPDRAGRNYLIYIDDDSRVWCQYEGGGRRASGISAMTALHYCRSLVWGDAPFSLWERYAPSSSSLPAAEASE